MAVRFQTDGDCLLAAIQCSPDDDSPRLQYSDWLDEHGEPERAQMIRWMCSPDEREHIHIVPAGRTLIYESASERWQAKMAALPGCEYTNWRRGFVESVICAAVDWLAHSDTILAVHPVREVRLVTLPGLEELLFVVAARRQATGNHRTVKVVERPPFGQQSALVDCLAECWPAVWTWHLPPETARAMDGREYPIRYVPPTPEEAVGDAATSAGPPDNARRRGGHSRMPGWLADQRSRPRRR